MFSENAHRSPTETRDVRAQAMTQIPPISTNPSRRGLLIATALIGSARFGAGTFSSRAATPGETAGIKALVFDIQGTVVDYHAPLVEIGTAINERNGLAIDWTKVSSEWVGGVAAIVGPIAAGRQAWMPVSRIFQLALQEVLKRQDPADQISEKDRIELMSVWSKMRPWPDSLPGIARLKQRYTVAALSNGGMAGIIHVSKAGGLPFDAVLTGELAKAYKPAPEVYGLAVDYLGFPADQIMMVAAHKWDLKGAKAAGLKTAFIPRPGENGSSTEVNLDPEPFIDIMAGDLGDLAAKLGA